MVSYIIKKRKALSWQTPVLGVGGTQ